MFHKFGNTGPYIQDDFLVHVLKLFLFSFEQGAICAKIVSNHTTKENLAESISFRCSLTTQLHQ